MLDIGKELLVGYLNLIGLGGELGANTDELADAALGGEVAYLSVENIR